MSENVIERLRDMHGNQLLNGDIVEYNDNYGHKVIGTINFGYYPCDGKDDGGHLGWYIKWENDGANCWDDWWRHDIVFWLEKIRRIEQ